MIALLILLLLPALEPVTSVAQRLEDHYNHLQSLQATFTQRYRSDERAPVREESGIVYLSKPGKMRWEYKRPEAKLFVSDGHDVYFYAPDDHQATRTSAKQSDDVRTPLRFLLGKLNLHRLFARVEFADDLAPIDPGDPVLKLWPKKGETFRNVYLEVDSHSRLRRLVIDDADGSRNDLVLAAEEPNPRLPMDLFHFTPPPGTQIVDERSPR